MMREHDHEPCGFAIRARNLHTLCAANCAIKTESAATYRATSRLHESVWDAEASVTHLDQRMHPADADR